MKTIPKTSGLQGLSDFNNYWQKHCTDISSYVPNCQVCPDLNSDPVSKIPHVVQKYK